ncbi:TPR-like protein [Calocera cornea HHB12733]|uniref:TPR-like protein n=1 Tax=Calocera cornea HHB12733 TaxID=1353952 RepID=A0A165JGU9_9BASI|nr:TPR-like protein [Calocera cornea HHB12733]
MGGTGAMAEQLNDLDRAMECYQRALRHDPDSKRALAQIGAIARAKEDFPTAVDYLSRVLSLDQQNGELWSALGHCYLMLDVLPKAYSAYQQALYCLASPTNVKLWYGIGILYDRYGSLEHAEEAFTSVLRMEEGKQSSSLNELTLFQKTNEVYFRLGIIYKQQHKYDQSLDCFQRIADDPPAPLRPSDILFQIGHVYEQKGDWDRARSAYERVLQDVPNHAKVLQQLGWLFFQSHTSFHSTENAIECLTRSLGYSLMFDKDESDAQSWYLLGRAYMAAEKYNKAYEAYQQAVYRDGRNPTFWCSIGVLYYQIQQFRDALDAYSRAIRINPYISEVWFDLGCLYESCNNQISDAIDAYKRALELDTDNQGIKDRLRLLEEHKSSGGPPPPPPPVQDVHPTAYASSQGQLGPPTSLGLPLSLGVPSPRYPIHGGAPLPPMAIGGPMPGPGHRITSPSAYGPPHDPFRPPHMASAETSRTGMALAPMDIDRTGPPPTHGPASALPSMALEPPYVRESNGSVPPLTASATPAASSPVAVMSPNGANVAASRTDTPNGISNPRKRMTPPSPTTEGGLKRQRLDVPSPPRVTEPTVVAAAPVAAVAVPPSPPHSPAPPPITTLEEDVSSPESTRSRSPVEPSDQLMDSRNSPVAVPLSPPADVAKVASAPDVGEPMAVEPAAPEITKIATTDGPKEDSPMDMGE